MRILIIADIDDLHWRLGKGGPRHADLILSLGDVADQVILEASQAYNCPNIFAVKGNHDANTPFPYPITDLHMTVRAFQGINFGGLNGSWRYKAKGPFLYDQSEVINFMAAFPAVDVFISHNSPQGIHDRDDGVHCGFEGLTAYIKKAKPKMLVHGHQHVNSDSCLEETEIMGVYGFRILEI